MGGKSTPATSTIHQTTSSTATPYAPAVQPINDMLSQASTALAATPKTPVYTGPNDLQLQAKGMMQALAPATATGADVLRSNAMGTANGDYLPGGSKGFKFSDFTAQNPNIDAMIQATVNPLRQQLDSNVLSIGDAAKLAGAYGGDRQDILKGQALTGFNREALDAGGKIRFSAWDSAQNRELAAQQAAAQLYSSERNRQVDAGQQFQTANTIAANPATVLGALGDTQATEDLAAKTAAIDAPWQGLDKMSQVLAGVAPYASSTGTTDGTETSSPAKGSKAGGVISGALGGASAGAPFGPWGAGIGAVVGGLGGLFG